MHSASPMRIARLSRKRLLAMLATVAALLLAIALLRAWGPVGVREAGSPLRQSVALCGTLLLFVPVLFTIAKRGGLTRSPPAWFVAHVLASACGAILVTYHASGGQLMSLPGILLALLLFLVLQGTMARVFLSARFSQQFGSRPTSYLHIDPTARAALAAIIENKRTLLTRLDPAANEALFSPNLRHALRHPWLTLRYARLAAAESRLVGARNRAGPVLSLWRRIHIAVAALFVCGIFLHVVLVTFFAGYVAAGRPIYWWHLAAWGAS